MTDENKLDVQKQTTQEYYGTYPGFRIASGIKVPDGDLQELLYQKQS